VNGLPNDGMPRCPSFSPTIASHIDQHAQFSVLPEQPLELRHEVLVICFLKFPAKVDNENIPAVFFI
jgi:hypothetical protein